MSTRRQLLCCLGGSGVASLTGCLRLEQTQSESTTATKPDFSVSVVGRQFEWGFAYPEFEVSEREELVLPIDTTVKLEAQSEDVYHSLGIEELDIKLDAVPGERTQTTITPETTGEYTAICTEICGEGHSEMTSPVRLVSKSDFENWRS